MSTEKTRVVKTAAWWREQVAKQQANGGPPRAGLTRSSADAHEREAARSGHVASCCGRPDTRAKG